MRRLKGETRHHITILIMDRVTLTLDPAITSTLSLMADVRGFLYASDADKTALPSVPGKWAVVLQRWNAKSQGLQVVCMPNKGDVKNLRAMYSNRAAVKGLVQIVLVGEEPLTPFASKHIMDWHTPSIQFFLIDELYQPIILHALVPAHILLKDDEAANVRAKYPKAHLHTLLASDPVVRFYNFPVGAIILVREVFGHCPLRDTYMEVRAA